MRQRSGYWLNILLILSLIVTLLTGCAGVDQTVRVSYPLESVNGSGSAVSYVYRAAGITVPEVAAELIAQSPPEQQSPEAADRMFLVYANAIIHLQQDRQLPADTLIEVDTKEYVRNNYSMSFLQGYLLASLVNDLFDYGRFRGGNYRGYTNRDIYKPTTGTYRTPTTAERQKAPPMTVDKQGSVVRRTREQVPSTNPGGSDSTNRTPNSGRITRDGTGSGGYNSGVTPRKSKVPRTKAGVGRVRRRR